MTISASHFQLLEQLEGSNKPVVIKLLNTTDSNKPIAEATIANAATSAFKTTLDMSAKALENCISIESLSLVNEQIAPAILYFALRRARIMGKQNVIALVPSLNDPMVKALKLEPLEKYNTVTIEGNTYYPVAQRLKYAISYAYKQCTAEMKDFINSKMIDEIVETVEQWLNQFFEGAWATAIKEHRLSKVQYIYSLYNLYQYVKQTTQHLGRCVALAPNIELRNHYIYHLRGEVNHEIIIENDLRHLNADLDYLTKVHVPNTQTKEFMVIQESTIGFYQDTVLMLACPLAAEGISSHMTPAFLEALCQCISRWGVDQPRKAAKFFESHTNTDGGDDGHWLNVVKMIAIHISDENYLQHFLSVLNLAMNGLERSFNSTIEDLELWAA